MLFRSNDTATTEIYTVSDTLSLHDALPISLEIIRAELDVSMALCGVRDVKDADRSILRPA